MLVSKHNYTFPSTHFLSQLTVSTAFSPFCILFDRHMVLWQWKWLFSVSSLIIHLWQTALTFTLCWASVWHWQGGNNEGEGEWYRETQILSQLCNNEIRKGSSPIKCQTISSKTFLKEANLPMTTFWEIVQWAKIEFKWVTVAQWTMTMNQENNFVNLVWMSKQVHSDLWGRWTRGRFTCQPSQFSLQTLVFHCSSWHHISHKFLQISNKFSYCFYSFICFLDSQWFKPFGS